MLAEPVYSCYRSYSHSLISLSSSHDVLQFDASLFQWLYSCVQQKRKSGDLYTFVVQFSLDIILVYLHAVYENLPEVCSAGAGHVARYSVDNSGL